MDTAPAASAATAESASSTEPVQPDTDPTAPEEGDQVQPDVDADGEAEVAEALADYIGDEELAKIKGRKIKLKLDGEDAEMTVDEILRNTALNKVLTKRGQEASQAKKEAQQQLDALAHFLTHARENKTSIWELAEKLGHNPDELAEERVWNKIQYEKMSPAEKRAHELEKENAILKHKEQEREKQALSEKEILESQQAEQDVQTDVEEVLKLLGKKPTARLVARIAEVLHSSISSLGKKPSHRQVADKIRASLHQDLSEYLSAQDIAALVEAGEIPKEFLNQLSQYQVRKASKKLPGSSPSHKAASTDTAKKKSEKIGVDTFFKNLGSGR
jgi:hypothetical protein